MPLISLNPELVSPHLCAPLVVVIPIYNEAASIEGVVKEWMWVFQDLKTNYQFLLINDGSKDDTLTVLKQMEGVEPDHIVVVDKANAGHGRTCRLGYTAAVVSPYAEWILQHHRRKGIDSRMKTDQKNHKTASYWLKKDWLLPTHFFNLWVEP